MNPPPGYEIISELGRGTTGVVYKARESVLGRIVAVQFPHPCSDAERHARTIRFLAATEVMARLPHPDIVPVHAVGEHAGMPFYVRRFVDGDRLEALAASTGIDLQTGLRILCRVAETVRFVHERGVAHRNLEPSNILFGFRCHETQLIGFGRAAPLTDARASADVQALQHLLCWFAEALAQPLPAELERLCAVETPPALPELAAALGRYA